jgi:hypothetical protein
VRLPLSIEVRPSRRLALIQWLAHGLAVLSVLGLQIPWPAKAGLISLLLTSAALTHRRWCQQPISRLHLYRKGLLEIEFKGGIEGMRNVGADGAASRCPATVEPWSRLLPGLLVLGLRVEERVLLLALLPDSMSTDAYRRLCVWFRWGRPGLFNAAERLA